MRLLLIVPYYEPAFEQGGVTTACSALCRAMVVQGVEVTVFTTALNPPRRLDVPIGVPIDVGGVQVRYFEAYFAGGLVVSPSLGRAVKTQIGHFDLLYIAATWQWVAVGPMIECARRGVPYLYSTHGMFRPFAWARRGIDSRCTVSYIKKWLFYRLITQHAIKHAAAVHFTTEIERLEARPFWSETTPSFVIPNVLDRASLEYDGSRTEARRALGLQSDRPMIAYIGRLEIHKGLELVLDALGLLAKSGQRFDFALGGPSSPYLEVLKDAAASRDLADQLHYLGFLDEARRRLLLAAADAVVLISPGENFGYTVAEAMAAGRPVIVSPCVGLCGDIAAHAAGIVVAMDAKEAADAILRLLSNPVEAKEMGSRGQQLVRLFEPDRVAELMLQACEDVLSGQRSPQCRWSQP